MNSVILVIAENIEEIKELSSDIAQSQKSNNTGKLCIIGSSYLDDEVLKDIAGTLEDCFEVIEINKVQLSGKSDPKVKLGVMLSTFFSRKYTATPGPWLVIDSGSEVVLPNPLTTIERNHNAEAKENSGRAYSPTGGGRIPVGPVVIGAHYQKLNTLRSVSGQDWRDRGRFAFYQSTWNQMTADDYPFRVSMGAHKESETSEDIQVKEILAEEASKPSKFDLPVLPEKALEKSGDYNLGGMQPVEMNRPVEPTQPEASEAPVKAQIPKPFMRMDHTHYHKAEKKDLFDQVKKRTGEAPHHATGVKKLISILSDLDEKEMKASISE